MKHAVMVFMVVLVNCLNPGNHAEGLNSNPLYSESIKISDPDSTFEGFILQFGFDSDFQLQRIAFPLVIDKYGVKTVEDKSAWKNDRLFADWEAVAEVSYGNSVNEHSNERVFSWITIKSETCKSYYFKKRSGKWLLMKIEYEKYSMNAGNEDFYFFLGKFCTDSIFQKQRIIFPLDMIYLDNDYNEAREKRSEEKWNFRGFYYDSDSVSTMFNDFNRSFEDTDKRIFEIRGVENGIGAKFTFRRIKNQWFLIKYEDYST